MLFTYQNYQVKVYKSWAVIGIVRQSVSGKGQNVFFPLQKIWKHPSKNFKSARVWHKILTFYVLIKYLSAMGKTRALLVF